MLNRIPILSIASILSVVILPAIASAGGVNIQTSNTKTVIDDNGEVYVEIIPLIENSQLSRDSNSIRSSNSRNNDRTYSDNTNSNCRTSESNYQNSKNGNTVYSRSSTTICQ